MCPSHDGHRTERIDYHKGVRGYRAIARRRRRCRRRKRPAAPSEGRSAARVRLPWSAARSARHEHTRGRPGCCSRQRGGSSLIGYAWVSLGLEVVSWRQCSLSRWRRWWGCLSWAWSCLSGDVLLWSVEELCRPASYGAAPRCDGAGDGLRRTSCRGGCSIGV